MAKTKLIKAKELKQDDRNLNRHSVAGREMIQRSLSKLGAGRSILVDQNGKIIAGNMTAAEAEELGIKFRQIETNGDELIVVKRTDLNMDDLQDSRARELAFADNRIAEASLNWNYDEAAQLAEEYELDFDDYDFDLSVVGNTEKLVKVNNGDENSAWVGNPKFTPVSDYFKLIINFETEADRNRFEEQFNLKIFRKGKTWSTTWPYKEPMDPISVEFREDDQGNEN